MKRFITEETFKRLKEDLLKLKTKDRLEVAERIKIAKEFGDLSENAEYKEARESQGQLEQRIFELETILNEAQIRKPSKSKTIIDIGVKFEVKNLDTRKKIIFELVGFGEANPMEGKISTDSPLGSAFLDKKANEEVKVKVNGNILQFQILKII
ncbi:MAG: transcription elongation factor GreA [Patescibacteria group bacterium]